MALPFPTPSQLLFPKRRRTPAAQPASPIPLPVSTRRLLQKRLRREFKPPRTHQPGSVLPLVLEGQSEADKERNSQQASDDIAKMLADTIQSGKRRLHQKWGWDADKDSAVEGTNWAWEEVGE